LIIDAVLQHCHVCHVELTTKINIMFAGP